MIDNFCGVPVYISAHLDDKEYRQVRFPKSRKKRIRKKWRARASNFRVTIKPVCYEVPGVGFVMNRIYREIAFKALQGAER